MRKLAILAVLAVPTVPAMAQTAPPSPPQIIAAIVEAAPDLEVSNNAGNGLPGFTAIHFVTQLIYELGINTPASGDQSRLVTRCQSGPQPSEWRCDLTLLIHWDGSESAMIGRMTLLPDASRACDPGFLEGFGPYSPCVWAVKDQRLTILMAG